MNINANSNMSESILVDIAKTIQREDRGGGDVLDRNVMRGPEKHDKKVGGE